MTSSFIYSVVVNTESDEAKRVVTSKSKFNCVVPSPKYANASSTALHSCIPNQITQPDSGRLFVVRDGLT